MDKIFGLSSYRKRQPKKSHLHAQGNGHEDSGAENKDSQPCKPFLFDSDMPMPCLFPVMREIPINKPSMIESTYTHLTNACQQEQQSESTAHIEKW